MKNETGETIMGMGGKLYNPGDEIPDNIAQELGLMSVQQETVDLNEELTQDPTATLTPTGELKNPESAEASTKDEPPLDPNQQTVTTTTKKR